jgi:cytoskeletal protein CcmA (bactofilin family)
MSDPKELVEDENKIDTVIADDITFRGSLVFKNSLKIKGAFEGKIDTDGQLIIGREAKVSADVKAGEVDISGQFNGKIRASRKIELLKKSRTGGDIVAPDVTMESGSVFNGTCIMEDKS